MTRDVAPIDIGAMPDLARLAEEVARTGMARVLQRDHEDVARLVPMRRRGSRPARPADPVAERTATLANTFGAWKDLVNADQLKRELYEAQSDDRPALQL
ncbi:MAG: hypothetical protein U0531_21735 [Dehalococcoidia bacterium]